MESRIRAREDFPQKSNRKQALNKAQNHRKKALKC